MPKLMAYFRWTYEFSRQFWSDFVHIYRYLPILNIKIGCGVSSFMLQILRFLEGKNCIIEVNADKILAYRTRANISRGLYTFYPLFEVHLCTVTFGLMYGL